MRISRFFKHKCTMINPGTVTGQDPYGRDIYEDEVIDFVPCRVDQIRKRSTTDEYGTDYVTQNMVFLDKDQPVKNSSRFKDFTDERGNAIIEGEYRVQQVTPAYKRKDLNHYEVTLTEGS